MKNRKAEDAKDKLIGFASQGGDERTQAKAEKLIKNYLNAELQALKEGAEDAIVEAEYFKPSYSEGRHAVGRNVTEKVIPYEKFINIITSLGK